MIQVRKAQRIQSSELLLAHHRGQDTWSLLQSPRATLSPHLILTPSHLHANTFGPHVLAGLCYTCALTWNHVLCCLAFQSSSSHVLSTHTWPVHDIHILSLYSTWMALIRTLVVLGTSTKAVCGQKTYVVTTGHPCLPPARC